MSLVLKLSLLLCPELKLGPGGSYRVVSSLGRLLTVCVLARQSLWLLQDKEGPSSQAGQQLGMQEPSVLRKNRLRVTFLPHLMWRASFLSVCKEGQTTSFIHSLVIHPHPPTHRPIPHPPSTHLSIPLPPSHPSICLPSCLSAHPFSHLPLDPPPMPPSTHWLCAGLCGVP